MSIESQSLKLYIMAKSIISLYHFKFTVIVVMSLFIAFASCSQHAKLAKSDKTQEVKTTKVVLKSTQVKNLICTAEFHKNQKKSNPIKKLIKLLLLKNRKLQLIWTAKMKQKSC